MRIGMILPTQFPPDIRVEKEIGSLAREHDISLLCANNGTQMQRETVRNVNVIRVLSRLRRGWANFELMTRCRSNIWRQEIEEFVREVSPDVLHVHDLPLLGTTCDVAEEYQVPVVADLHENYPAMLEENRKIALHRVASMGRLVSRVAVSIPRWKEYEFEALSRVERIVVVVEEARDRLVQNGISKDQIDVVGNYEVQHSTKDQHAISESLPKGDGQFNVLYVGGFDATRDLHTVVSATALMSRADYPDLRVWLVGGKGRYKKEIERQAARLGLSDRISILAWVSMDKVDQMISAADVGLVPHVKSPHTDSTLPHKLFQYMWRQVPVITSNCRPLERIVNETRCGLVYESGNAKDLAGCVAEIYMDKERSEEMARSGRRAVVGKYNWQNAGAVLQQMYHQMQIRLCVDEARMGEQVVR